MGRRSEQRIAMRVPVVVRGKDERGAPFVLNAHTHDIAGSGASLSGLNGVGRPGEKIELEYRGKKAMFRVQWVGLEGTPRAGQVGVRCLEPGNYIWGVPLPDWTPDSYDPSASVYARPELFEAKSGRGGVTSAQAVERRKFPRQTCRIEALVADEGAATSLPAKVTDISLGGCYVEMLSPLPLGTLVELTLNPGDTTLQVRGKVRVSQMGMGMGVAFTGMSPEDFEKLRTMAPPVPVAPSAGQVQPSQPHPQEPATEQLRTAPVIASKLPASHHPSTGEALEAIARVLFRKGIITRAEVGEELKKLLTPKS
jgi:hypothetical protein